MPQLRADKRAVKQVLLNFLSNAIKFTPPGGQVSIGAGVDAAGNFALSVTDNGIGMTPAEVEVALTPFGQVDSRLARQHVGTGLGLPVSRSLMRLHGGEVVVASALGIGTTIRLRFPAGARARQNRIDSAFRHCERGAAIDMEHDEREQVFKGQGGTDQSEWYR